MSYKWLVQHDTSSADPVPASPALQPPLPTQQLPEVLDQQQEQLRPRQGLCCPLRPRLLQGLALIHITFYS